MHFTDVCDLATCQWRSPVAVSRVCRTARSSSDGQAAAGGIDACSENPNLELNSDFSESWMRMNAAS